MKPVTIKRAFASFAMMAVILCSVISPVLAADVPTIAPNEPRLEFVFEAKVQMGELVMSGKYDGFTRGALQLIGGTFEGPKLRGKVLPSTHDWPVYLGNGVRSTDVAYKYVTDDGHHLFVTVSGYRYSPKEMTGPMLEAEKVLPPPNLLRIFMRIQAPDNSPYSWMTHSMFVGVAGSAGGKGVATLRVYRLL